MSPSLLARFLDHYLKEVFKFSKENAVAVLISILTVVYTWNTGHFTANAWKEDAWGELFPWVVIICLFAAFYAIKAAWRLCIDLKAEGLAVVDSGIFLPTGQKHQGTKQEEKIPHYRPKAYAAAFLLVFLFAMIAVAVWYASHPRGSVDAPSVTQPEAKLSGHLTRDTIPAPIAKQSGPVSVPKKKQLPPPPKAEGPTNERDYDWMKRIAKVSPPGQADADALRPI